MGLRSAFPYGSLCVIALVCLVFSSGTALEVANEHVSVIVNVTDGFLYEEYCSFVAEGACDVLFEFSGSEMYGFPFSDIRIPIVWSSPSYVSKTAISIRGKASYSTCGAANSLVFTRTLEVSAGDRFVSVISDVSLDSADASASCNITSIDDWYMFMHVNDAGVSSWTWSQSIKSEPTALNPSWSWKAPVVMFQEHQYTGGIIANISDVSEADLDTEFPPWLDVVNNIGDGTRLSFGVGQSVLVFHSIYARDPAHPITLHSNETKSMRYLVWMSSSSESAQGFQDIVADLWGLYGRPNLIATPDQQQNVYVSGYSTFETYRAWTWNDTAQVLYVDAPCPVESPAREADTETHLVSQDGARHSHSSGGRGVECAQTWRTGIDLPGSDLWNVELTSTNPAECQSHCCEHSDVCRAWAMVPHVDLNIGNCTLGSSCCWLKYEIPRQAKVMVNVTSGAPGCPYVVGKSATGEVLGMKANVSDAEECGSVCCTVDSCEASVYDSENQTCTILKSVSDTFASAADSLFVAPKKMCGTIRSQRNGWADHVGTDNDAWFNAWFQNIATAYGMHVYATERGDERILDQAERMVELALHAPQDAHGLFPSIFWLANDQEHTFEWFWDSGWAGLCGVLPPNPVPDACKRFFHQFDGSWTAYWLLRFRERRPDWTSRFVKYVAPMAQFLTTQQLSSGAVPSWFRPANETDDIEISPYFQTENAETSGAALMWLELYDVTHDASYLRAAELALHYMSSVVLPRKLWWDYETFLSCSHKPFDFYDSYTNQGPENNLGKIRAGLAYLKAYRLTKKTEYLNAGKVVVDYVSLAQSVWDHPKFSAHTLGGTTTQNTDAEWNDARQAFAGMLYLEWYKELRSLEWLERGVAALRASLSVAPFENWAHSGGGPGSCGDCQGALSSFHWGQGSGMAMIEMYYYDFLGDLFVDLDHNGGVGVNGCSLKAVSVSKESATVSLTVVLADFAAWSVEQTITLRVLVHSEQPSMSWTFTVNGHALPAISEKDLVQTGLTIPVKYLTL